MFHLSRFIISLMDRRRHKIEGFTLIELYTVMAILSVLISIAGLTTRARNENLTLSIQHEKLRSLFIRAKFLATNSVAPPGGGTFCGYGVNVDVSTREVFIFADKGFCEGGVPLANNKFVLGEDERLTSSLDFLKEEAGIGFACFTSENSNDPDIDFVSALCGKNFVFVPPDPKVYVNQSSPFPTTVVGVYSKRTPKKIRKVIINQAGLIDAL